MDCLRILQNAYELSNLNKKVVQAFRTRIRGHGGRFSSAKAYHSDHGQEPGCLSGLCSIIKGELLIISLCHPATWSPKNTTKNI